MSAADKTVRALSKTIRETPVTRGEMAERVRAFDWSTTPLGPMDQWPQSLRTVVNILLSSR